VQSVPITTDVVSLNPTHGEMYSTQLYVIKFVSDLGQVDGFLWVLLLPHQKTDCHDIADVLLKMAFNTITLTPINEKGGNFNGICGIIYSIQLIFSLMKYRIKMIFIFL
jgi:hypothetical protein